VSKNVVDRNVNAGFHGPHGKLIAREEFYLHLKGNEIHRKLYCHVLRGLRDECNGFWTGRLDLLVLLYTHNQL
jgi:hypothetical protein